MLCSWETMRVHIKRRYLPFSRSWLMLFLSSFHIFTHLFCMSQEIRFCVFKMLHVRKASLGIWDIILGDFLKAERCDTEHASILLCKKFNIMYFSVWNTESSAFGSGACLENLSCEKGRNVWGIQNTVVAHQWYVRACANELHFGLYLITSL